MQARPLLHQFTLDISGMSCSSCSGAVESAIRQCGVNTENITISLEDGLCYITVDPQKNLNYQQHQISKKLADAITDAGYDSQAINIRHYWIKAIAGTLSGIIFFILMLPAVSLSLYAMYSVMAASSIITIIIGWETYVKAFKTFMNTRQLTMDSLLTLSTTISIVATISSIWFPWMPMMCDCGPLIFGLRNFFQIYDEKAKRELISSTRLTDLAPAEIAKYNHEKNQWEQTKVSALKVKDRIRVAKDEIVPVDGICQNSSEINNSHCKGWIFPAIVNNGDEIKAGARVTSNIPLEIIVSKEAAESYLASIVTTNQEARLKKSKLTTHIETLLNYYIPVMITFALISAITISLFASPQLAIQCFVTIIVAACPCSAAAVLRANAVAFDKAAKHGALFKNGEAVTLLANTDRWVFDYNGTATKHQIIPRIWYHPKAGLSPETITSIWYALEKKSTHEVAKAIGNVTQTDTLPEVTEFESSPLGLGVSGNIGGKRYTIGPKRMMEKMENPRISDLKTYDRLFNDNTEDQIIFLACEDTIISVAFLQDPLGDDAKQVITALGQEIYICTGADECLKKSIAARLAIPESHVSAGHIGSKPKADYVKSLKEGNHRVTYIGDGINDIEALAAADCAIAVNRSLIDEEKKSSVVDAALKKEADLVIEKSQLIPLLFALEIAKETDRFIIKNIIFTFATNIIFLLVPTLLCLMTGIVVPPGLNILLMLLQNAIIHHNLNEFQNAPLRAEKQNIRILGTDAQLKKTWQMQPGYHLTPHPTSKQEEKTAFTAKRRYSWPFYQGSEQQMAEQHSAITPGKQDQPSVCAPLFTSNFKNSIV
jgi:Cu2+-exporting ATPase